MSTCIHREGCADHHRCKAADRCLALRKDADVNRLTFPEWFKREYPLYEREGASRDTSLKAALRIAWETAERQSLSQEAVRDEALSGIIDELAAIADACVDLQQNRKRPDSDPVMSWDNAPLTLGTLRKARALKREPNAAIPIKAPLQCPACLDVQPYAACCCMKSATARSLR